MEYKKRKPSELVEMELKTANTFLPEHFYFVPEIGIECYEEDAYLPMADLKQFLDYLISINVDPYAE